MADTDDLKGRVKEAAGDLTDDEELQQEGRLDQASGKVKETLDDARERADDAVDEVKERLQPD